MTEEINESYTMEQIAMTLAAIAYADEIAGTTIAELLEEPTLATQGQWKLVWGPHKKETNQAYVVELVGATQPTFALAIRGTQGDDPFSWLLDLETALKPTPWNTTKPEARLSQGMVKIWGHLTSMPDLGGPNLLEFLRKNIPTVPGVRLIVAGHSQGGASASMMALWVKQQLSYIEVQPYTFAGETAGNAAFAEIFNQYFSSSPGGLYVNENDLVPRAFDNLQSLPSLYDSVGISMPSWLLNELIKLEKKVGDEGYTQPDRIVIPNSIVYPPNPDTSKQDTELQYVEEVAAQHSHIRYLWAIGAEYKAIDPTWHPPSHLAH